MKKRNWLIMFAVIMTMLFAFSGCGSSGSGDQAAEDQVAEEQAEDGADQIANPWQEAVTAEEAAVNAGVGEFAVEGIKISLGTIVPEYYQYMDGMVEASIPIAAVDMTIRKGDPSFDDVAEGDISGDYGEYKHQWTRTIKGLEVTCFGNRQGEATKTIWTDGDYSYSVLAFGAGGDENYGLPKKDVKKLVKKIK